MAVHIALMRGINVGGKNKLPMEALAQIFEGIGCTEVSTYIQSGNVIFSAPDALIEQVPSLVGARIEGAFGLHVPIVLRSTEALCAIARNTPFPGAAPRTLHVVFLRDQPDLASLSALDPQRSPPDRFLAQGSEIYLHCPEGIGRSKLTNAWFDRSLGTISTMRNYNTVCALAERVAPVQ